MKTKLQIANSQPGTRKVRADAILKNLSQERQDEIAEFARTNTLVETLKWLEESGTKISVGTLSVFLTEYRIRQQMQRHGAAVKVVLVEMLKQDPSLTPELVQKIGQNYFSGMAMEQKDARVWDITQQIELKKGKLDLERQKHSDDVKDRRAKIKKGFKAAKKGGGIRAETLEQIERELKLM